MRKERILTLVMAYPDCNQPLWVKNHIGWDFNAGYTFNKALSLQAGYSQMFANPSLEFLLGIQNPAQTQNWIYLMLIFRPDSDKKYIGVVL